MNIVDLNKEPDRSELNKFTMSSQFCTHNVDNLAKLVQRQEAFVLTSSVLNLVFSFVAILGNLVAIRALWKASSIPVNLKKLLLSLAFSDLAVGLSAQLMSGAMTAVMLKIAANGNHNFGFLCPIIMNVRCFFIFFLSCASFLGVIAIAVDRLLAISLHLRYQELVTSKRVVIALVCLWLTSATAATIFISLPKWNGTVIAIVELVGLLSATVAYIHVYKVVRYHQNQIQNQLQIQLENTQATRHLRDAKSAVNALFIYIVFLACYLPVLCAKVLLLAYVVRISFLVVDYAALFLVFLNSSLNPLVYCWRYREVREIAKSTVKQIFRINEGGT